jgi:hypothetical protein
VNVIIQKDRFIEPFRSGIAKITARGVKWASRQIRIISLETVAAKCGTDDRYGRIETWPDQ